MTSSEIYQKHSKTLKLDEQGLFMQIQHGCKKYSDGRNMYQAIVERFDRPPPYASSHVFKQEAQDEVNTYAYALLGLAYTQRHTGHPKEALQNFERLFEYAPGFTDGSMAYVRKLSDDRNYTKAIEVLTKFSTKVKDYAPAYLMKAECHYLPGGETRQPCFIGFGSRTIFKPKR